MVLDASEIDIVICLLEDMDMISGLKPEERELYERLQSAE